MSGAALLAACSGSDVRVDTPTSPTAPVPITPQTAPLVVQTQGLPDGVSANVRITGPIPGSTERTATAGTVFGALPIGRYTIDVIPVRGSAGRFSGFPANFTVEVTTSGVASATAVYRPDPSRLRVTSSGLPANTAAAIAVTRPNDAIAASIVPPMLLEAAQLASGQNTPDLWRIAAQPVESGGARYTPTPRTLDTIVRFGDTAQVAVQYALSTGALAITVSGTPNGVLAPITVLAPDNAVRSVTGTTTLVGLEPGRYRVIGRAIDYQGLAYRAASDTVVADVTASLTPTTAAVRYVAQAGQLVLSVSGLPASVAGALTISGPNAWSRTVTGSSVFDSLPAGSYTIRATTVSTATHRFLPSPRDQTITITTGGRSTADVSYTGLPTVVDVSVTGLPTGTAAAITLTGPDGSTTPVTGSQRLAPAVAGRWRLAASSVITSTATYAPTPTLRDTTVTVGDTLRMPVAYALTTGMLAVAVTGLPNGTNGVVTVAGPSGFTRSLTGTVTLTQLTPGNYVVNAATVTVGGISYVPTLATQTVAVSPSLTAAVATVQYIAQAGGLVVTVTGLPSGLNAAITLTAPDGTVRSATRSTTWDSLPAGVYTLRAAPVLTSTEKYAAAAPQLTVTIPTAGAVATTVTYVAVPTVVDITVTGVPSGSSAAIMLTAPNGTQTAITGTQRIAPATAGRWRLAASSITTSTATYTPTPTARDTTVSPGDTLRWSVAYALTTGSLAVTVSGLPAGANGSVTVTGPGTARTLTASTTLTQLTPGNYTVSAASVTASSTTYNPTPTAQTVTVSASLTAASANVQYTAQTAPPPSSSPFDITVRFIGTPSAAVTTAFNNAAARWKQIITADLHTTSINVPAGTCDSWIPAVSETVNDLVIYARITPIDGAGSILGQASPCLVNSRTQLTALGFMEFDEADMASLSASTLGDVVLHEMGHVLGIGSLWSYNRTLLQGSGTSDPFFSGSAARTQFAAINTLSYASGTPVPVEATGGAGTAESHWRESVFGRELMTGWINAGTTNPLSRVTAASLQDLGYTVSVTAADAFTLAAALQSGPTVPSLPMGNDIKRSTPLFEVGPTGILRRIPRR